ncbi:MAG: hypothetical protein A3A94_00960 [Candidatus Portnoybacteria bacterium RIFCSPLOWO2_01_FULL_43_11]|uniref:Methyltransferase type 11 domain-containing protein n=4 Tax=Candidatus Portnoyibacteriota TaxID=1817913 RepID=A0A1G2FA79_9BACT|nr:MAG: hypothetical protein A2815_00795 [Candidatus Portnoybacteria bacterium RIFCSPHIGHO2_01_FULL_40_12b]OGZ36413.1 MAG: hypothetical protein A3D38_01005 [Candidatus Portnoybacteria bacterium RIFCSPHIGHO2_02_FULL_40_23]OGZ38366.1 MAG: hypothetical protein A3E90_00700 [Candidatus Portnoybacteria bacterium RIFCSPHIGHO2_12_FULL_40_11]OGZ39014.1 MAG: hypothetical protein A3A94_00960 [Candidatus Portnoybacteria bacterium RIFCSPLOWO2_01_FULL_43_11]OGZ40027.1 MAG: hypothetical protein A3I20_01390 [C
MKDVFGKALAGYFNKDLTPYLVQRDDGLIDEQDIGLYFTKYSQWKDYEKEVLKYAKGKALDIGAGAGRHTLYLQNRGLEVHAIDISPLAVEVMKKREVKNAFVMDFKKLNFPDNHFDSILMMFNNFGLAGSIKATKKFLKTLNKISAPKGMIITTIRDPYQTDDPRHLAYHKKNRKAGKPIGQVKIRIEYNDETGDWFSLLMVSPDELKDLIKDTGWRILKIIKGGDGNYGAVLEKLSN